MKKTILAPIVMLAIMFAGGAYAADDTVEAFQGGITLVPDTDCSLLSQRATITASANVHAAYYCDTTTTKAYAATCHEGGSANPTTVSCTCPGTTVGTVTTYTPNNTQCSCDGLGVASPVTVEMTGKKAFGGSSDGGIIGTYALAEGGSGVCDATNITTISLWP
jgi:hypothetical protein